MRALPAIAIVAISFSVQFSNPLVAEDFKYWGLQDETLIRGNLVYADMTTTELTVVIRDREGNNHRISLATLTPRSQTQAWQETKAWASDELASLVEADIESSDSPLAKKMQTLIAASNLKIADATRAELELRAQVERFKNLKSEVQQFTADKRALGETVEIWTSDNGHQTKAKFVVAEIPRLLTGQGDQLDAQVKENPDLIRHGTVVLLDETGKTIRVPLSRLSKESKLFAWNIVMNRSRTAAWMDSQGKQITGTLEDIHWDEELKKFVFHWQSDELKPTSLCTAENFSAAAQLKLAAALKEYPQAIAAKRAAVAAAEAATIARVNQAKPKETVAAGAELLDLAATQPTNMGDVAPSADDAATSAAATLPVATPLLGHWRTEVASPNDPAGETEGVAAVEPVDWYISKDSITRVAGKESKTKSFRPKYSDAEIHVLEILGSDKETYVFMLDNTNPAAATCVIGEGTAESARVSLKRIDGRQRPF
jgi:hypothetical protein